MAKVEINCYTMTNITLQHTKYDRYGAVKITVFNDKEELCQLYCAGPYKYSEEGPQSEIPIIILSAINKETLHGPNPSDQPEEAVQPDQKPALEDLPH